LAWAFGGGGIDMRLASEDALADAAQLAAGRIQTKGYRQDMLLHPVAGWCLRNYLILTECPELLGDHCPSVEEQYWSRYYWLFRFAKVWSAVSGYDAGLEQQVFQFLEYAPNGLDGLSEVETAAEQAASEQIRAAAIG
jgi:hypothetical protein